MMLETQEYTWHCYTLNSTSLSSPSRQTSNSRQPESEAGKWLCKFSVEELSPEVSSLIRDKVSLLVTQASGACLQRQDHVWNTTDELFRFRNKKMPRNNVEGEQKKKHDHSWSVDARQHCCAMPISDFSSGQATSYFEVATAQRFSFRKYRVIPGHKPHRNDPVSVFLSKYF